MQLWNSVKRFALGEEGLETVEWAVVGTLVVIAAIVAFGTLGTNTNTAMTNIANTIPPGGGTGTGTGTGT
jgi:Flp pilus assembly pilin Flp